MPKIPTFTTQARPTAEVGGVKTGLQAPIPSFVGPIQSALTDYYVKAEQASNITEAQKIKNSNLDKISELTRISGNISNPRVASETFAKGYQEIMNNTLSTIENKNVKTLVQNSFLEDEYKFKYQVLNQSGKLLESQTKSTLDEATTSEIATVLATGNKDLIKQLPSKLNNFYDKFSSVDQSLVNSYKTALPKKITVANFYNNLNIDPSATLQAFDKGAYPELKGEERQKYRNVALSEITKRTTLLEKQITYQSSKIFQSKWKEMFSGSLSDDDIINDGELKGLPVLQNQMIALNKNAQSGNVTKIPDFDNVINVTKKILNGEIKNLTDSFRVGFEFTSKSILERNNQFSKDSLNTFAKVFQKLEDPQFVDQHKKFFNFIDTASIAVKSNPNFKNLDSEYNTRLDNFYNQMYSRFQNGIANKKNTNDLLNPKSPDYIAKDLYKFIPDSAEIMKGLYKGIVKEDIKSKVIPRLPGETPDQYKKRIGG